MAATVFSNSSKDGAGIDTCVGRTQDGADVTLHKLAGHVENLYLEKLKHISNLKANETTTVGDRNWCNKGAEPAYLAIHRDADNGFAFTITAAKDNPRELVACGSGSEFYGTINQLCFYAGDAAAHADDADGDPNG
jgi:hypothetical protein